MNPINPYGSSTAGPSRFPEDSKGDPLQGVGGASRFTRRGAIRGKKDVRGVSGYLESRVGRKGGKKAHAAAAKMLGLGRKIKETGEKTGAALGGAAGGLGKRVAATVKQVKEKIGGKKGGSTPEQIEMKNLAKEGKAKVGKLVSGGKRNSDKYKPDSLGRKPFKIPRAAVSTGKGGPSKAEGTRRSARLQQKEKTTGKNDEGYKFSPDLTKVLPEKFIFPKAKVSDGDGSKAEGTRRSARIAGKRDKGILKQSGGPKTGGKGGIRWADQEGKPLEQ
ncbi:hypothetical protein C834K_0269 [Chlamydia poikilotherma]|uniref:Uncharacterized protein n=1 Tax=Chlamydia poikilotherma TaxID=1967783 RepID=A0A3B0PRV7_9CHLA|nr:hypothetical protein [Chlamydia poikilotherma]SYX08741.1 hypothetical protein C834K_0269 [Chlamydia poikilotherma]